MNYTYRVSSYLILPLLFLVASEGLHAAPLMITGSVTPESSNFLYDFAITNQSSTDPYAELVSVDFPLLPAGAVVGNASAPTGFGAVTDADYILFSYNNGPSFPLNVTTDGFQFVSTTNLGSIDFEANYFNSGESQLSVVTGTVSPQAATATPEPSTWILLTGGFLFLLGRHSKRRYFSRFATRDRGSSSF